MRYNVTSNRGHDKVFYTLEEARKYSHSLILKGCSSSSIFEVEDDP